MKACFMGLGYIGLPTAIIAAGSGIQVIGVDVNPKVVEMTNRGIIHIVEPGLQELCSKVMEFGKPESIGCSGRKRCIPDRRTNSVQRKS